MNLFCFKWIGDRVSISWSKFKVDTSSSGHNVNIDMSLKNLHNMLSYTPLNTSTLNPDYKINSTIHETGRVTDSSIVIPLSYIEKMKSRPYKVNGL